MFLHSGAGLHGHEYSDRSPSSTPTPQQQGRPSLLRSAFTNPLARPASAAGEKHEKAHPGPPSPNLPRRPVSLVYTLPLLDHLHARHPSPQPEQQHRPASHAHHAPVVRFREPERTEPPSPAAMSEDDPSVYDSDASESTTFSGGGGAAAAPAAARRKRRTRASPPPARRSNVFVIAVPAPRFGVKQQLLSRLRPKLLMQLQQVSADRRPRPVIDVFPSSLIAGWGPLAAARYIGTFPRLFGMKGELRRDDVILVRSEDYAAPAPAADAAAAASSDSDEADGGFEGRELVAVLSPLKKENRAEIVLADGSVWVATPLPSGSYDFVYTDAYGNATTARWAKRAPAARASSPLEPDYRYTFSLINPLSRRHPVLATLTPTTVDIQETYTTVSSSQGRHPPSRPLGALGAPQAEPPSPEPASPERTTRPVDEATKNLIAITAVWLGLRLRPAVAPAESPRDAYALPDLSLPPELAAAATTLTSAAALASSYLAPNGGGNHLLPLPRRSTSSGAPAAPPAVRPQRATSTGAVFVQRRRQQQEKELRQQQAGRPDAPAPPPLLPPLPAEASDHEEGGAPLLPPPPPHPQKPKPKRRLGWFRKLTH